MDGNFYVILRTMHQQLRECRCTEKDSGECIECVALHAALVELERVPRLQEISDSIEQAFFAQE